MLRIAALLTFTACIVQAPPAQQPQYAQQPGGQPQATCTMGSNGVQACGFDCQVGADGIAACANAPGGRCSMGSDGHVYCSEAPVQQGYGPQPQAQCELNSDGTQTCGYNCQLGSDGHHYCASQPGGQCGMNADGTFTCS